MPTQSSAADDRAGRPLRVLLAGGGTAGHVNPLLATAAALRDAASGGDPGTSILVLGTKEGLEQRLVPEAGYELAHVPRVPMPRRPTGDLLLLPRRLRGAVAAAGEAIRQVDADVVVGFGGFVSTPAYLAARSVGVPVVIHEQNARPGLANRLGARWAAAVALTFASTPLAAAHGRTEVTGLPLRPAIGSLVERQRADAAGARRDGAAALGLDPAATTVLVTGGSLGAQHLNEVMCECADRLPADLQVLHLTGRGKDAPVRAALERAAARTPGLMERYHVLDYLTEMEQAYACADGVICRSGAGTVAELTALGLPALYVPLPIGNGEQRLNAADCVSAGGGQLVADADLDAEDILGFTAVLTDESRRRSAAAAAASTGVRDGAQRLAALIREVAAVGCGDAAAAADNGAPADPSSGSATGDFGGIAAPGEPAGIKDVADIDDFEGKEQSR
ncbi:UDP-N-acetylglucosamine--N-acetylmuramyl-(pentapeptide) pyrophosphoryl-undecaprenol N-acetylglucosamine transferase [Actinomyces sp. 432]|uniref:UDP-N-acetylglucosamine--N-acetylmuramyl- (pentapeptide) pyrophosphoryl-undecaprenol N-acetylglucosamine transferase n=1 Tax=Actinomyces sp. 432 TaxID=2057798 RepID=UPI001374578C|nr:UDP-N-acetylglucosamine--N-acetylmuramyl-(pentapeptide) pyrophosphoryl-undecaprenol N-acetylglucosamine transferase [Actinomyces sp. 432]QHO91232.1 UDP-N-acetylglucosamine--N-acetylmuramyl-(pentapeptide) pyrophosphoryl-undecaprenol N-acetylglucosamine transferase [Actinomyces sp. 432]